ncbi:MAG: serine/threonine protein kinase, partial [bacterium]|nr:serine/threonine protein kinase [bacterium]
MVNVEQAKRLASDIFSGTASLAHQRDPERIGRYRITRRIAIGGMGTVYAAEEERPHRAVAIKVLKPAIDPETAIRRFWLEAEVLGHLRHPGIAHIYEASIHEDGATALPYIVMEFVPGALPISVYCDTHNIDTRGRLELFAEACEAVQHAHQKGVIHRDLKPANVLVDAVGRPKVIDFGIARATNPEISSGTLTQGHQLLGSMPYMSPEQCVSGPCGVDTRSDVYSMGVVLYELLCGRLPRDLTGCSALEGARRIREDAPVSPSTVRQELRGDLEAILLVALARD